MWQLKIKGFDKDNIYGIKAIKNKVSVNYYPFNYYIEKEKYYFIAVGLVKGSEENINSFFNDLKKDKQPNKKRRFVIRLEKEGNFFVCITCQYKGIELKKFVHLFYNPKFIHLSPAILRPDGYEEWGIASIDRKDIENLIKVSEKQYNGKVLSLKEIKLKNLGILKILPELTEKQKQAFDLAVDNRYYEYPRGIELEKLAKIMKISLSTYQEHLRKAEIKLLVPAKSKINVFK